MPSARHAQLRHAAVAVPCDAAVARLLHPSCDGPVSYSAPCVAARMPHRQAAVLRLDYGVLLWDLESMDSGLVA